MFIAETDIWALLEPVLLGGGIILFGLAIQWLKKQSWMRDADRQLAEATLLVAQRAKDKYLEELDRAKDPASEEGAVVTANEKSVARQVAYDMLLQHLTGPLLDYARGRGEDLIKAQIGYWLDKLLGTSKTEDPA